MKVLLLNQDVISIKIQSKIDLSFSKILKRIINLFKQKSAISATEKVTQLFTELWKKKKSKVIKIVLLNQHTILIKIQNKIDLQTKLYCY